MDRREEGRTEGFILAHSLRAQSVVVDFLVSELHDFPDCGDPQSLV